MPAEDKKCCSPKKTLMTLLKVLLGFVFLVLGGWATLTFWQPLLLMVKGCIGLFLILIGVIILAVAKE